MFKSTKTNLIIRGILFVTLGILCFFNAEQITETIGTVIGLAIIVAGVLFFILGMKGYSKNLDTMRLSLALLLVPVGIMFMIKPEYILVVLSVFVLFEGIDFILTSFKYKKANSTSWWLMLVLGLVIVALSCITIFCPNLIENLIGIFIGCALLAIGCASFTALTGLNIVEDYFEAAQKALEDKDAEFVETEVIK
jgi:uncharacterized membrane protein HdeD (DUF308 family)